MFHNKQEFSTIVVILFRVTENRLEIHLNKTWLLLVGHIHEYWQPLFFLFIFIHLWKKESRNRSGVAHSVPGGLGSQISMTWGTLRWWGRQPHAPATFTSRKYSWYSFSLGAGSTPGPWCCRKEYVTEKSSDSTGNRSWDSPTSSGAP